MKRGLCLNLSAIVAMLMLLGCSYRSSSTETGLKKIQTVAFILPLDINSLAVSEKNDFRSLRHVLSVSGITCSEIPVSKLKSEKLANYTIIVVPFATAKSLNDTVSLNRILQAVKSGSRLLIDSSSVLSASLGIKFQKTPISISCIGDSHFSADTLYWTTRTVTFPIENSRKDSILSFEKKTHQPIAVSGMFGNGRFISIATLFDPNTIKGYSRYPFLIEWMERDLGLERIVERQAMEMYFDPGMREDNTNIDSLASLWRQRKIKRVYVAGWYYDDNVDYIPILRACHQNGIQAFCWLETPEVNKTFWDKHPEWREKTATGRDANIDWRKLMNLADENCRNQVWKEINEFLMKNDWDGVNFAEMYFEPHPEGFDNPDNFTPMNSIVRNDFKQKSGFDPIDLFNSKSTHYWKKNKKDWKSFANYRKQLSYTIKGQFLEFLNNIKKRKGNFDVMMTGIDVSLQPAEADNIGESTELTLKLYKKYNITLQIEDPSNCWGTGPERYAQLGKLYRKTVNDENRLVFDCNVVGSHEKGSGGFPSEKPSGEEIRQIAYNMASHNVRPAFYAEDGVNLIDFKNISTVLAGKATITESNQNEWIITTPYTIIINIGRQNQRLLLDKKPWFAQANGQVIIPQGRHTLNLDTLKSKINPIYIKQLSGELQKAEFADNELTFSYSESVTSCYIILDRKPETVFVDGNKFECVIQGKTDFILKLPQGNHVVRVKI